MVGGNFGSLVVYVYTKVYNNNMINTQISGFQWDRGNFEKCQKHGVSIEAIESLFLQPVLLLPDESHSEEEQRFRAIGKSADGRSVFIVFTIRQQEDEAYIRPISARYMHQKEVDTYEEENPNI